jgi:hypothetical protein
MKIRYKERTIAKKCSAAYLILHRVECSLQYHLQLGNHTMNATFEPFFQFSPSAVYLNSRLFIIQALDLFAESLYLEKDIWIGEL